MTPAGAFRIARLRYPVRRRGSAICVVALALACLIASSEARADGDTVRAWGFNGFGNVGDGTTTDRSAPKPVPGLTGVAAVAAGAGHSLALLSNGTVEAWGHNFSGQLGNGSTTGPDTCQGDACSTSPIPVPGLSGVVEVAAGNDYSMALLRDGTVRAWGDNFFGELGDGTNTNHSTPKPVAGLSKVVSIAAGGVHGLAVLADGSVRAWGGNQNGELGNGNNTGPDSCGGLPCSKKPIRVAGVSRVMSASAGLVDSQSVVVLSNGTIMDWGLNFSGELGNGNNTGPDTCGTNACSKKPIPLKGLSGVVSSPAGAGYTFARRSSRTAMAWGVNLQGELGDGSTTDKHSPQPVPGLSGVAQLAAGDGHTLALLANGTARAWGRNDNGQLGIGNETGPSMCGPQACSKSPIPVALTGATAVAAGGAHSLALVGPSSLLKVSRAGRGSGAVGAAEILCPLVCAHRYPLGSPVSLVARPAVGTRFAGFSGACKGVRVCRLALRSNKTVVATFGKPKGTKITKARIKRVKGTAKFRFTAPGAITGFQCALVHRTPGQKPPAPHFTKCKSGKRYKGLAPGGYTFRVRALDILGADPVPARKKFKI